MKPGDPMIPVPGNMIRFKLYAAGEVRDSLGLVLDVVRVPEDPILDSCVTLTPIGVKNVMFIDLQVVG